MRCTDLPSSRRRAGRPAAGAVALAALLLAAAGPARAQEQVLVRRLSDVVAVRTAESERERVLYYFRPTAELVQGDEVEQGVGGHSELTMPEGGRAELFARAHVRLERIHPEIDVLSLPTFTTMEVSSASRPIGLRLPGGITCRVELTTAHLTLDVGRLTIRNEGGQPLEVRGPLQVSTDPGARASTIYVERGEEVRLPVFEEPASLPEAERTTWADRAVRHAGGEVRVEPDGRALRLWTEEEGVRPVTVGGVRTRVPLGPRLLIRDWRPHVERPLPISTAEVPAAPDAPARTAAASERNDS